MICSINHLHAWSLCDLRNLRIVFNAIILKLDNFLHIYQLFYLIEIRESIHHLFIFFTFTLSDETLFDILSIFTQI